MWVRSLSLPPPNPLVLTGKGRSSLQPKLPTLPLRPLSSLCVLCVFPILMINEGLRCFHSRVLWWFSCILCFFVEILRGSPTQFLFSGVICMCGASVTLVMDTFIPLTTQYTHVRSYYYYFSLSAWLSPLYLITLGVYCTYLPIPCTPQSLMPASAQLELGVVGCLFGSCCN